MAVQYSNKIGGPFQPRERRTPRNDSGLQTPPSKTLFIGNMAFEMSDQDLNDLFKDIKNVVDVRVAIDRRTGQPRGFAHADFIDIESAQQGRKVLATKEVYGRSLRVDFSAPSRHRSNRDDRGR
jgi:nucleolin